MALPLILICIALLLATAAGAIALRRDATRLCLRREPRALRARADRGPGASGLADGAATALVLPLGLPWLGAHFRLDALAAFFLVGGQSRRRRGQPLRPRLWPPRARAARVLPFFPAFLAGMNLVVLADDAFTFLFAWEFMSLASWALVMAHHRDARQCARRLHLSGHGELRHAGAAAGLRPARRAGRRLRLRGDPRRRADARTVRAGPGAGAARRRLEGRPGAAACLAAARPSGRAEPRLGADERRHDQGRGLRLRAHRLRPARARRPGGGAWWCWCSAASPRCSACCTR